MKSWDELSWWSSTTRETAEGIDIDEHRGRNWKAFPPHELVYKAFELTPFDQVKVVILGQDPYPTKGHAHGLAFSVPPHVKPLPPSLRNILTEYETDLGLPRPRFGDLSDWARRGVLLLNTILTVAEGRPLSHSGLGWHKLTVEVLQKLSEFREHIVFILWGRHAGEFRGLINEEKHHVISSPHPSPFSAHTGFFGSRPFSRANDYLASVNIPPIDWRLR